MPCAFLIFSGWLVWLESSYWGWGLFLSFLTTITPHIERKEEKKEKEEVDIISDIKNHLKKD